MTEINAYLVESKTNSLIVVARNSATAEKVFRKIIRTKNAIYSKYQTYSRTVTCITQIGIFKTK